LNHLRKLLLILAMAALVCVFPAWLLGALNVPVAFPHVQMPAEPLTAEPLFYLAGQPFHITNTMMTTLLADIVLLLMAVTAGRAASRRIKQWKSNPNAVDEEGQDLLVPKGWQNAFEAIVEYLYDLVHQVVGAKWVRAVLPLVATIFLLVLTANWLHFVPGVDSVGVIHCAEAENSIKGFGVAEMGHTGIYRLAFNGGEIGRTGEVSTEECPAHHAGGAAEEGAEGAGGEDLRFVVTPFLRTATTDLNMTLGIALVTMVVVQVFGVRELGASYFTKFINLPALDQGPLGYIFFAAGFIEIISELAKIISFSLRLFGNLFAGTILLFVMTFLIPVGVPVIFYLLEVFVGLIQAFVFAMLALVFIGLAMTGHGDEH
jgi:F-type H+-transporting ATPase subunit a